MIGREQALLCALEALAALQAVIDDEGPDPEWHPEVVTQMCRAMMSFAVAASDVLASSITPESGMKLIEGDR